MIEYETQCRIMIIGHSAGPADETTLVTGVEKSDINIYVVLAEVPKSPKVVVEMR